MQRAYLSIRIRMLGLERKMAFAGGHTSIHLIHSRNHSFGIILLTKVPMVGEFIYITSLAAKDCKLPRYIINYGCLGIFTYDTI